MKDQKINHPGTGSNYQSLCVGTRSVSIAVSVPCIKNGEWSFALLIGFFFDSDMEF